MRQSVPSFGLAKPRFVGNFPTWTMVVVQVTQGFTLYLAETDTQLMAVSDDAIVDALQIAQGAGIVSFWWIGDMWAAGNQAAGVSFKPFILVPTGINTGSGLGDGNPGAWGISPSVTPATPGSRGGAPWL